MRMPEGSSTEAMQARMRERDKIDVSLGMGYALLNEEQPTDRIGKAPRYFTPFSLLPIFDVTETKFKYTFITLPLAREIYFSPSELAPLDGPSVVNNPNPMIPPPEVSNSV